MKEISQSGASRNRISKHRFDLLVWEFIDAMAMVMAEGAVTHGEPGHDGHWQKGFDNEAKDIWNHVFEHHRRYREGDKSEPHLAKMAIGCMFQWYFDKEREANDQKFTGHNGNISEGKTRERYTDQQGRKLHATAQPISGVALGTSKEQYQPHYDADGCNTDGNCSGPEWYEGDTGLTKAEYLARQQALTQAAQENLHRSRLGNC